MSVLKIYRASDDSLISEAPTTTNAILFTLNASLNEVSDGERVYAKCDAGYQATTVTIAPTGTTSASWQLNTDPGSTEPVSGWAAYGAQISLGTVTTTPSYFWVRAKVADTESIGNDTSVTLVASGVGEAV